MRIANHRSRSLPGANALRRTGLILGMAVLGSMVAMPALAQSAKPAANVADLRVQADKLRAQLKKLTGEIETLKKGSRSVAKDYRLRDKLAEAESVGRKLTEIESVLRKQQTNLPGSPLRLGPAPVVRPTDGPLELSAKADILLDQAERFEREAGRLEKQAVRAERRDTLRRRVRRIERDPFITLEAPKRSVVLSPRRQTSNNTRSGDNATTESGGAGAADDADVTVAGNATGAGAAARDGEAALASPPSPDQPPEDSQEPAQGADNFSQESEPPTSSNPGNTAPSFAGDSALTGSANSVLPTQFRTLLDQQTLAEVRRLENLGTPASRAQALRKAVQSLRAKAKALKAQAKGPTGKSK